MQVFYFCGMERFETKSLCESTKDIDSTNRIIKGYLSVFGNIDSDDDIIKNGAFTKTLESGRQKHIFMHNPNLGTIGKFQVLKEDDYGLYFESKLNKTTLGNDVFEMYSNGEINEHSIGFRTLNKNIIHQEGKEVREITEIMLFEGSTVLWGANDKAVLKMYNWMNEHGQDEGLYNYLKTQVEIIQDSLSRMKAAKSTFEEDSRISLIDTFNKYYKNGTKTN